VSNLYLVGFMGVGKTVVGRLVAERLHRDFVDLDEAVERRAGMRIPEIFQLRGEAAFRTDETAELELVTARGDLVVALGGGAFSVAGNRRLIDASGGISVFLDLAWEAITRRLGEVGPERPKWIDPTHAHSLYRERRADYESASLRLELDGEETPAEVAESIVALLPGVTCAT
jgi:shikimate kinase